MTDKQEPLQPSSDEGSQHEGYGADEDQPQKSACCGPCAGFVEAISLFWIVPGFWRLGAYMFCSSAGGLIPAIYYLGPLSSQVWNEKATSNSLVINACSFTIAIFGAPLFGMWSDGRSRKLSMLIQAGCSFIRVVPFILSGFGLIQDVPALWSSSVISILTSPFCSALSGSPVLWAWMTDVIPPEHRETGFSLIFSLGALSTWVVGTFVSQIQGITQVAYLWIGVVLLLISILLIVTGPTLAPLARAEDPDPLARQKTLFDLLVSPFRLVARKRSLRLLCGVAAFVTLPDVAVTYVASQLVYTILGIEGNAAQNVVLQGKLANWFSNFPNIFLIIIYALVGVFAKRFGPAKTLAYWTPITCIFFAAPALFQFQTPPGSLPPIPLQVFCGVMMASPISIYPPLQALVALLVPPSRVGEAMGAVAACKNVASLCAPLIMFGVTSVLDSMENGDRLYWTLFPGGSIFMLAGAWPFALMLNRRMNEGTETDAKWSVWSSAAGSIVGSHAGSVRNSRLGSRISTANPTARG